MTGLICQLCQQHHRNPSINFHSEQPNPIELKHMHPKPNTKLISKENSSLSDI